MDGFKTLNEVKEYNTKEFLKILDKVVFMDLQKELAIHSAKLLLGNGYYIKSDNEKIKKFLNETLQANNFENILYTIAYLTSRYGRVVLTINKTATGDYYFQFADFRYYNRVGKAIIEPLGAVLYKHLYLDDTKIIIKETWDTVKVVRDIDKPDNLNIEGLNVKVPKDQQIEKEWRHNLGILPIIEFLNKPMSQQVLEINGITNFYELADDEPVKYIPHMVNNMLRSLFKEILTNKTRLIGNFSSASIRKLKDQGTAIAALLDEFMLSVKPIGKDGVADGVEVVSPEGNIFGSLMDSIQGMREKYFEAAGYSLQNDAVQDTATQTLYAKSKDVETTKFKRNALISKINDLLDRLLLAEGLIQEIDADKREYSFIIRENLNVSETETVALVIQQIESGLMTREEGIAKIRGLDEPEEAAPILKAIQEQEQEDMDRAAKQNKLFTEMADNNTTENNGENNAVRSALNKK